MQNKSVHIVRTIQVHGVFVYTEKGSYKVSLTFTTCRNLLNMSFLCSSESILRVNLEEKLGNLSGRHSFTCTLLIRESQL